MNSKFLKLLLFSIIFTGVKTHALELRKGIEIGSVVANTLLISPNPVDYKVLPILAYNINLYFELRENDRFGISFEPGFIEKGQAKLKQVQFPGDKIYYVQYQYLQLPVLCNYYLNNKFSISCGSEFSYLKDANMDDTSTYDNIINVTKGKKESFEMSGMLGLNYRVFKNIDICLRYNRGLTYVQKRFYFHPETHTTTTGFVYNQYLQLLFRIIL